MRRPRIGRRWILVVPLAIVMVLAVGSRPTEACLDCSGNFGSCYAPLTGFFFCQDHPDWCTAWGWGCDWDVDPPDPPGGGIVIGPSCQDDAVGNDGNNGPPKLQWCVDAAIVN